MGFSYDGEGNDVNDLGLVQGTVTVTTSQAEAKVGGSPLEGRESIRIYNGSSGTVYFGPAGVSTSTGEPLRKNQWVELPYGENVAVYLIAASAVGSVIVTESA